jgi:hypothetical protein
MAKPYIVRKVKFTPDREPQRPHNVWASSPEEATEKVKGHAIEGGLILRGDGVYQGFNTFNLAHLTDTVVEVIPVRDIR